MAKPYDNFETSEEAQEFFEAGFRRAFQQMRLLQNPDYPLTVYYAFRQDDEYGGDAEEAEGGVPVDLTTGWETLLEALISSRFQTAFAPQLMKRTAKPPNTRASLRKVRGIRMMSMTSKDRKA